ncbi:MAG: sigma 54-interacting transcriptional regulator [Treponema sp.]|nr:sigma 54-interacting transcriptional regulator [Treponema sp.]
MLSKINNASFAVVASDNDILLFFECVFEEEVKLSLFLATQVSELLRKPNEYDYIFIDTPTAFKEKTGGCWRLICELYKDRIFILTALSEIPDYFKNFSEHAKSIPYPFTKSNFLLFFNKALEECPSEEKTERRFNKNENEALDRIPEFSRLLGSCQKVNEIKRKLLMVADTDTPIVFFGESGTGKTLTAKIAHDLSLRKKESFVIANMANGNRELFESILFGNVKGAFTDARDREGLFKKADKGTLFMDEIAELSLECQAKLLRVIETGLFRPVGSDEEFQSDVRLIFATNANLNLLVKKKLFREDLYWRIVDFPIEVPALRERVEDFPLLVTYELEEIKRKWDMSFSITGKALEKMIGYEWPGNFRQFKACIRRAAILSRNSCVIDEDAISF